MYRSRILSNVHFVALALLAAVSLQCITYTRFPSDMLDKKKQAGSSPEILQYRIIDKTNVRFLGGVQALEREIRHNAVFQNSDPVEADASSGTYVRVTVDQVQPHLAALVFGYVSLSTLTILPFWSTEDGYDIRFDVIRNGKKIRAFDYEIRRSGFVWITMLPFAWVNLFTHSEADAFRATTRQFFEDARASLL